jgi:outer membrane protein TolC
MSRWYKSIFPIVLLLTGANAPAADKLSIDQYLDQVKKGNQGYRGQRESSEGAELRSEEGSLLLAPTIFGNGTFKQDSAYQQIQFSAFDYLRTPSVSLGISKLTTFGLQARLTYSVFAQYYINPIPGTLTFGGPVIDLSAPFYTAALTLEVTQSIWSNGFGRGTRANQELLEAQALASHWANSYQAQATLVQAEIAYWTLGLARRAVRIQQDAHDRAEKLYEWNQRRARLQLGDRADALQAEARLQSTTLELQGAQDAERSAARAFNTARGTPSEEVSETLVEIDDQALAKLSAPKRAEFREDVLAAREQQRAASASATLALERDSPTLEIFGALTLYGQGTDLSQALGNSLTPRRQGHTAGVRFSAPLNIGATLRSREGWSKERDAADLVYQRKVFEQDRDWIDLNTKLADARKRLSRSTELERLQRAKLDYERDRLNRGRTTTFQVLQFEQEYLGAEYARLRDQVSILSILAQLKLYGENT